MTKHSENTEPSNSTKPVLPAVFYGIFKIQRKGVRGFETPQLYTSAFSSIQSDECEILTANDVAFKSEDEAKEKIAELPRPAMYIIMPIYMVV